MIKHQSRPTSKIKINSKASITTTTMDNRQTPTIIMEKKRINYSYTGKRKNVSLGDKTQVKCLTGRYRLTSIGLNNLSEHEK